RKAARRVSARGVSARARHGRPGRAARRTARHIGTDSRSAAQPPAAGSGRSADRSPAGSKRGRMTAPTSDRILERLGRLHPRLIDEEALIALLEECERANRDAPITFFEITTAAAFLGFARTPADIVLLEVGLGGRLDATNVVRGPTVTAITPVSLDHQAFLGDT